MNLWLTLLLKVSIFPTYSTKTFIEYGTIDKANLSQIDEQLPGNIEKKIVFLFQLIRHGHDEFLIKIVGFF